MEDAHKSRVDEQTHHRLMSERDEHMAWCKQRALDYLELGDVPSAISSMLSDLSKHPETVEIGIAMSGYGLFMAMNRDEDDARRFIEGFR